MMMNESPDPLATALRALATMIDNNDIDIIAINPMIDEIEQNDDSDQIADLFRAFIIALTDL